MFACIFGSEKENNVSNYTKDKASGKLKLEKATVDWSLSLDANDLPEVAVQSGKRTYRSIKVDGKEVEFSGGFTDLHTVTYQNILAGNGFGVCDARASIGLLEGLKK